MPKKKAPAGKPTRPKNNSKKIITIQHREIKHTGRKYDNGFLDIRLWLPLWELPVWFSPTEQTQDGNTLGNVIGKIMTRLSGGMPND